MGKGRKPCCDKAGVKRGPWSQAEDTKLISFIQKYGHSNWRALPKLAGLARCGKSCRLRWVNYLRPDLKRGNFSPHEEETIIKLHEALGNRWSKIASHFPGRTDNEIKNVWNTHLKKRLKAKGTSKAKTSSTDPSLDEVLTVSNKDSSEHVLVHQTSDPMEETVEHSSSSSTSCNSVPSFLDNHQQRSDSTPGESDTGNPNPDLVENTCDKVGTCMDTDMIKGDNLAEELIEIPFEPDLDLWDLLDGDSNSADSEAHSDAIDATPLNPIPENDNKSHNCEASGSWWWLVYLENELGLIDHNELTPMQATSGSCSDELLFSDITI